MNILTSIPFLTKAPQQVESGLWEDRNSILQSNVNLFCWKRPVNTEISGYLGQLLKHELPPIQFSASIDSISIELMKVRYQWDQESVPAADLFWSDVSGLILDFFLLTQTQIGSVHLKVIDNNACAKFHTDGYPLRLFTTYYGVGTEWLPEKSTNRKGLGRTNDLIVKDPAQVQRMEPFDVGILKGEIPGRVKQLTKGIVHRSPEIAHTGEKRIILRVDV